LQALIQKMGCSSFRWVGITNFECYGVRYSRFGKRTTNEFPTFGSLNGPTGSTWRVLDRKSYTPIRVQSFEVGARLSPRRARLLWAELDIAENYRYGKVAFASVYFHTRNDTATVRPAPRIPWVADGAWQMVPGYRKVLMITLTLPCNLTNPVLKLVCACIFLSLSTICHPRGHLLYSSIFPAGM
jgi:hypothetical protein